MVDFSQDTGEVGKDVPPKGDLNWDTLVNGLDIDPFVLALIDEHSYLAQYGKTHEDLLSVGDIGGGPGGNQDPDGLFNGLDINGFVEILIGLPPTAVPEPATLLLFATALPVLLAKKRK